MEANAITSGRTWWANALPFNAILVAYSFCIQSEKLNTSQYNFSTLTYSVTAKPSDCLSLSQAVHDQLDDVRWLVSNLSSRLIRWGKMSRKRSLFPTTMAFKISTKYQFITGDL
jgi:hypothetical protein